MNKRDSKEVLELLRRCSVVLTIVNEHYNFYNSGLHALDTVLAQADTRGDLSRTPYDLIAAMRCSLFQEQQEKIAPLKDCLFTFFSKKDEGN